jgi:hypothetical protein
MLAITTDIHKLPPFVIFRRKTLPRQISTRNYFKSSNKRMDGWGANLQMVEQGMVKVARWFVMKACNVLLDSFLAI